MQLFKKLFIAFSSLCAVINSAAHDHEQASIAPLGSNHSICFIENKGQWTEEAKYKAEIPGGVMFLTDKGFVYNYQSNEDLARIHDMTCGKDGAKDVSQEMVRHHAYKVNFVNANTNVAYLPANKKNHFQSYFIGSDKSKWAGDVGVFGKISQKNVYDGIDVYVYSNSSTSLKYDFVVAAGANPQQIVLQFDGVNPKLTKDGSIKIKTSVNEVIEKAPFTYQIIDGKQIAVKSKYKLENGNLSFEFPDGYNKSFDLVIDPDLVFATYSGGVSSAFYAHSTTYDPDGNMYTGALAYGAGWPTTTGAFQMAYPGGYSVAVNKLSSDGSTLIYSTYFGGTATSGTMPNTMRVNALNELVVAGSTNSATLPTTTGAFSTTLAGQSDIYVVHFNQTGTALLGSTFVGGSGIEAGVIDINVAPPGTPPSSLSGSNTSPSEIIFDDANNIWVVSNSNSTNFPVTSGAFQATNAGAYDGVVFKLDPTCSNLLYSSYLGGSASDALYSIEIKSDGNIVVSGGTQSVNFPTTSGAMITTAPGGGWDGFVTIFSPTTNAILNSTYLGTNAADNATKLQIDCADNIYVLGRTQGNYPISPGVWSVAGADVFVDKLNPTLSASLFSTRVGSTTSTRYLPTAFLLDICGQVYVAGLTPNINTAGMPTTADAFETNPRAFWFCVLEPNFNDIVFGSYFGSPSGDHPHTGTSRFDPQGVVYHSMCSTNANFPTTPGSFSPIKMNGGTNDNLSFKFNFDAVNIDLEEQTTEGGMDTIPHSVRGCKSAFIDFSRIGDLDSAMTINYIISGDAVNGVDYQFIADSIVIPANQDTAILEIKPLLIAGSSPNGYVDLIIEALSPCGCEDGTDNIVKTARVRIYDSLYVRLLTPYDTVCPNTPFTIQAEIDSTLNYTWTPAVFNQGSLTINPTAYATSQYTITVTQPGAPLTCPPVSRTYEIFVEPVPQIMIQPKEITICGTDSLDINVVVGPAGTNYIYKWTPPEYLRDDFSSNNKFLAPVGDYRKVITVTTPVANCTSADSILIHVVPGFEFQSVSNDTTIKYGDTIRLTTVSDAVNWIWSPITYLSDPLVKDPVARPLETTYYEVIGIDQYGCRDTARVLVNVEHITTANIPNAFSPNGDGINDVFRIENLKFERMTEFKVFNRYGQVVFDTQDPAKGWDGNIKGAPADVDVYHYIIRLTMPDAKQKVFKGDVTLIR